MNIKTLIKQTPLVHLYIAAKNIFFEKLDSQSDESAIIERLIRRFEIPKSFIELGFSGWEFNCIKLAKKNWNGLLIDGDKYNVTTANQIFSKKIKVKQLWLDLDSISYVLDFAHLNKIGILSIDVDGNDYWFLEKLISSKPAIIIMEFNLFFGLRPISTPYDPIFDRTKSHESWAYYGASLSAMTFLANNNNYSLIDISKTCVNAFFIRNDLLGAEDKVLDHFQVSLEGSHPNGAKIDTEKWWQMIKNLQYVNVTEVGANFASEGRLLIHG
jgi:hypothetical protein